MNRDATSYGMSIVRRIAEKMGVLKTAAEFFKKRAGAATGEGLKKFLRNAPNVAPEPEDKLA